MIVYLLSLSAYLSMANNDAQRWVRAQLNGALNDTQEMGQEARQGPQRFVYGLCQLSMARWRDGPITQRTGVR